MKPKFTLSIDGKEIEALPGQSILDAAEAAGIYVPRLCLMKDLTPAGSCRICTVRVNGRPQSACTQPASPGAIVENDTEEMRALRRNLVDMLFVEGNHFCMFCEKSGNCELQALAYKFGITAPKYPFMFPQRELDASHPEIFVDRNRCVLCGRCVRASRELDDKSVFGFVGRSSDKRLAVDGAAGRSETHASAADAAIAACPTGSLLVKQVGFSTPVGERKFDHQPIGSDVEGPTAKE